MSFLAFDIRDALRSFRRDRLYAATAIVTMALTIGATTAMFSIVNGVLLRPLPYQDSHRLVALREIWHELSDRIPTLEVNERHFEYWREHAQSFESLAQFLVLPANLTGVGDATQISLVRCSGSLFDVLQVRASVGRTLMPSDDPEGAADVVTITDQFWRQRFGSDPQMVGRSIVLNGKPYVVVGILPPDFRLPTRGQLTATVDAFVPARVTVGWVGDHNDQAIGRLRDGITVERATAELDVLQAQVSEIATKEGPQPVSYASAVSPLTEYVVGASRRGLLLLLGAIVGVLLIACSNLANLTLTRTLRRLREAAIRSALGASRNRLIGRALFEQVLLSTIGGALGIGIAWAAVAFFVRTAPVDLPRLDEVTIDVPALVFALIVSILAGTLVALVSAWRVAGRDVQAGLRTTATAVASDRGALRSHATLLALQVGLSITLLVVTALFGASFMRVLNAERGFSADSVLAVDVAFPAIRDADESARLSIYDRLLTAVHSVPGVVSVSTTSMLPMRGQGQVNGIAPEGSTLSIAELPNANFRYVGPEFFSTLGIAVRRGRTFADEERDLTRTIPAVISEPTAARLWPGEDPIGKRFNPNLTTRFRFEVVGVITDARTTSLDGTQPLMVYLPYWLRSRPSASLLIKTAVEPSSMLPSVRRVIREVDPEIAVGQARPLEQMVDASLASRRYQAQLFVTFGLAALFIAAIGVYAVTAYGVSRRRREMNIRVALGAESSQVLGLVLRQGMMPVVAGAIVGTCGALAVGGLVASLLFDVQARDPLIIAGVVGVVGVVGLLTCTLAARQGLSLDPAAALRDE